MSIDLIIAFLFLILILLEYVLDISINNQLITEQTIPDSLFLKIIILLIYVALFFATIITWKLLWKTTFIVGMMMFIVMFFIFGIRGFRDIIKIMNNNS